MTDSPTTPLRYFASYNGEVKGPFDLDMIEAFILSGHYPQDVQICAEGSKDWTSHSLGIKAMPSSLPSQPSQPVGSKPTRDIPKWMLWGGGTLLGVLILMKMFSGGENSTPSASPRPTAYSTPPPPVSAAPSASKYDALLTAVAKPPFDPTKPFKPVALPKTYYSAPTPAATADDVVYKDLQGRSLRMSRSDYLGLTEQWNALVEEDSAISADQSKMNADKDDLEFERSYLDPTSQSDVDAFNDKVEELNNANAQLKERLDAYNYRVDDFNAELARVGTLIR